MNSLKDFKPISAADLQKDTVSDFFKTEFYKKAMRLEKIRMQRTRAANKGIQKLFVETYNKTHTDSKLKFIAEGIIAEYKTNDN